MYYIFYTLCVYTQIKAENLVYVKAIYIYIYTQERQDRDSSIEARRAQKARGSRSICKRRVVEREYTSEINLPTNLSLSLSPLVAIYTYSEREIERERELEDEREREALPRMLRDRA